MRIPHVSYANVTATLALVVALGGTSYAAVQLPKNSVKAKQIATSAVRTAEIKDGSVGSGDIADGAVSGTDIADGGLGTADLSTGALSALSGVRGPRAYGVISSVGQLIAARSRNVTVTKLSQSAGYYCVTPTAQSGIDPTKTMIVAIADADDGSGVYHSVMTRSASSPSQTNACPNGFGLVTHNFDDTTDEVDATNVAVSFVIP